MLTNLVLISTCLVTNVAEKRFETIFPGTSWGINYHVREVKTISRHSECGYLNGTNFVSMVSLDTLVTNEVGPVQGCGYINSWQDGKEVQDILTNRIPEP